MSGDDTADETYGAIDVQKWLGYLTIGEFRLFKKIVSSLDRIERPVCVNIGSGGGTSGLLIAEELRGDMMLYTVDIQEESHPRGCLQGERVVFRRAGFENLLGTSWFQIHGDSKEVGAEWEGGLVDLLAVDGDHTAEGCSGDFAAWLPHLNRGAYILVHDYGKPNTPFPGVDLAVDEMLRPSYEFIAQEDHLIVFRNTL